MKRTPILVQLTVPLDNLPPQEVDAVRRFLFQHVHGLDERHTRAWRRMWHRIAGGEVTELFPGVERSYAFHARHMAIENRIFENQETFVQLAPFRDWLKTGAAFGTWQVVNGRTKFVPSSTSYAECSDDEMREFHRDAVDFLHTPRALRRLWPTMKHAQRLETLELWLRNPKEATDGQHQHHG